MHVLSPPDLLFFKNNYLKKASDIIGWMNLNNFKLIDIAAISGEGVSQDGRAKLCDLVFHRKNQS